MPKEIKFKDPNCYNEAVLSYREQFSLMPNRGFRQDIVSTVRTYDDLLIWQNLLAHWGYTKDGKWHKRNPLDLKGLLTCFEFKQREHENAIQQNGSGVHCEESISERTKRILPKQRMPSLLARETGWK